MTAAILSRATPRRSPRPYCASSRWRSWPSRLHEAGIPYAAVAMSTDYDCWKTDEEPVNWEAILAVFNENAKKAAVTLDRNTQHHCPIGHVWRAASRYSCLDFTSFFDPKVGRGRLKRYSADNVTPHTPDRASVAIGEDRRRGSWQPIVCIKTQDLPRKARCQAGYGACQGVRVNPVLRSYPVG